ncbi:MAG: GAF domain-containing protein [Kaiparowitsia implicata GSE-PSE-MK54-09C]|jgi:DNA-binding CsgD family transcriptional regulator|nr:GAF domain-containing protein [Kaiparowitsia implicata GSE-PSE-MK54-09C]
MPAGAVFDSINGLLNPGRLLIDLQQANELARRLAGCMQPEAIARCITDGLVETFDSAFARIWLVEPDGNALRLVASSGMYTRLDGSFARVPMGAFKVGKIAHNQVPFLSNNLAEETWVKDRNWAIANNIRGFAGYPLMVGDRVVGVLAMFSHHALAPEFLEVLQSLCTTVAVALEAAIQFQQVQGQGRSPLTAPTVSAPLSDQIAALLTTPRLTLVGTEQPLPPSTTHLFLKAAEALNQLQCIYVRLTYQPEWVALEAIVSVRDARAETSQQAVGDRFEELAFTVSCLGGTLQTLADDNPNAVQVMLKLPYPTCALGTTVRVQCSLPVLHMAFTHLAYQAGLRVSKTGDRTVPLLTNDAHLLATADHVLWIQTPQTPRPANIAAVLDLATQPEQLRQAVAAVLQGKAWGHVPQSGSPLSEREHEILRLLTEGMRDRDIANHLVISESTVKFHLNNVLAKLNARTRYQAIHHAALAGWLL